MGIPVFWTTANSDPPWNFKIWLDQFLLAVTVKESVNPELFLEEPKQVLLEPLPRPETPREHENAQASTEREARDQLAGDKILLENEERKTRGPKVGHNVYYNEVQKRVASIILKNGEQLCIRLRFSSFSFFIVFYAQSDTIVFYAKNQLSELNDLAN